MINNYEIQLGNINNINETLSEKYEPILESIENEGYTLEYPKYHRLKEIISDDTVVGFITFEKLINYSNKFCINECYILPEYRGKGLLHSIINELIKTPNIELYLRRPSIKFMEFLLNANLATRLSKDIIVSPFKMVVEVNDVLKSKRIKKQVKQLKKSYSKHYTHFSRFYKMDLGSVVFKESVEYYPSENDEVFFSNPRKNDMMPIKKELSKIKPQSLKDTAHLIYENLEIIGEFSKNKFNEFFDVDELIGSEDKLNENIEKELTDNDLTMKDGFEIREKIINYLNKGDIRADGIMNRFNYLIGKQQKETHDYLDLKCPHCNNLVHFYSKTCDVCGHDLKKENAFKTIEPEINEFTKDIAIINSNGDILPLGKPIYSELENWIKENDYDYDEVYEAQCEYVAYEQITNLEHGEYSTFQGIDSSNKIQECSGLIYALNHDYLENLTEEKYISEIKNYYTPEMLKNELESYDIYCENNDIDEMIDYIIETGEIKRLIDGKFIPTEKGLKFCNNEILITYSNLFNSDISYYYYFKKLWVENIDKLSPDEITEMYFNQ